MVRDVQAPSSVVAIAGTILLLTVPERLWVRYAVRAHRDHG